MKKDYSLLWNNCRHFVDRMMDDLRVFKLKQKQVGSVKMSADQLTQYVRMFGSFDSTVKDNDKQGDSLDKEDDGKLISIQTALTKYPIGNYVDGFKDDDKAPDPE